MCSSVCPPQRELACRARRGGLPRPCLSGAPGPAWRSVAQGDIPWPFTCSGHQSAWGDPCGPPGGASWDGAAADGQPGWSPSGDVPQIGPLSSNVHQFGQAFVSPSQDTDRRPRGVLRHLCSARLEKLPGRAHAASQEPCHSYCLLLACAPACRLSAPWTSSSARRTTSSPRSSVWPSWRAALTTSSG